MHILHGRYGHVMFPQNLHPPAVQLCRFLINYGPGKGWGRRIFFTDNGSTGMEVAIKMALRLHQSRKGSAAEVDEGEVVAGGPESKGEKERGHDQGRDVAGDVNGRARRVMIITQNGCYHGDTLGTMVCNAHSEQ